MTRNTQRRVEVAAPVYDRAIAGHIVKMFETQLLDNVKLRREDAQGKYNYVNQGETELNSQELFYEQAYAGEWRMGGEPEDARTESAQDAPAEAETPAGPAVPEETRGEDAPETLKVIPRVTVELPKPEPGKVRRLLARLLGRN